ncbi:hypothetical protein E2C01_020565 [Portunus trituberculatus]|uniref:Uncharacterized protein n=1 Tax=Portunus trituberculatus TaxID=210409 RepID=A0A5B7E2M9_PORTR|nr:hypothetical protein [Portunus trituberculatus]
MLLNSGSSGSSMKNVLPCKHVEGLVDHALQVTEVLQGGVTLTVSCFIVRIEKVLVMRNSVVAILIEGTNEWTHLGHLLTVALLKPLLRPTEGIVLFMGVKSAEVFIPGTNLLHGLRQRPLL